MNKRERHRAKLTKKAAVEKLAKVMISSFTEWAEKRESIAGSKTQTDVDKVAAEVAAWLLEKRNAIGPRRTLGLAKSCIRSIRTRVEIDMRKLACLLLEES